MLEGEKKIFYSQGTASTTPWLWEGAQQEKVTSMTPMWEYKEQGEEDMAQAMAEQKGSHMTQDL